MDHKGEMFLPENEFSAGTDVVEEPSMPYGPDCKEDLFGDLRALLEHYEKRIAGLEVEMREVKAEVAALRLGKD